MVTIRESVYRIKGTLKVSAEDAFITDRYVYRVLLKYARAIVRRQDNESKLMQYDSLFETLPYIELIEVDKIESDCAGLKTGCKIMRTKNKIPKAIHGSQGPIFRSVGPIDFSDTFQQINAAIYVAMSRSTNFKYNKCNYFWYKNGYLYFPDITWDAVLVEAMWEEPLDRYCTEDGNDIECTIMQDKAFSIPDYLFAEIEQMVLQELMTLGKIPSDNTDDSQNILR